MEIKEIGIIHSEYDRNRENKAPRQGNLNNNISKIEVFSSYLEGLNGLKTGDSILVLYWADLSNRDTLLSKCRGVGPIQGVFSLRSPHRPNPILVCKCEIIAIEENIITVTGLDALDKSPLIDIKISI